MHTAHISSCTIFPLTSNRPFSLSIFFISSTGKPSLIPMSLHFGDSPSRWLNKAGRWLGKRCRPSLPLPQSLTPRHPGTRKLSDSLSQGRSSSLPSDPNMTCSSWEARSVSPIWIRAARISSEKGRGCLGGAQASHCRRSCCSCWSGVSNPLWSSMGVSSDSKNPSSWPSSFQRGERGRSVEWRTERFLGWSQCLLKPAPGGKDVRK